MSERTSEGENNFKPPELSNVTPFSEKDVSPLVHQLFGSTAPRLTSDDFEDLLANGSEDILIPESISSGDKSVNQAKNSRQGVSHLGWNILNPEIIEEEFLNKNLSPEIFLGELDEEGKLRNLKIRLRKTHFRKRYKRASDIHQDEDEYQKFTDEDDAKHFLTYVNPKFSPYLHFDSFDPSDGSLVMKVEYISPNEEEIS